MNFFMKEANVEKYIEMVADYDGSWMVEQVKSVLPQGSTLLELGMGPGKDLLLLAESYEVVGSDNSAIFVNRFKEKHPTIKAMVVDAINMNTNETFDCIYSNKVLHHLTKTDFITSLKNQKRNLNPNGIIFMTLWRGAFKEETMHEGDIRFTYYLEDDIKAIVEYDYDIIKMETYDEFDANDSLLVVLKNK